MLAGRSTPSYSTLDNINALDTAWVIRINSIGDIQWEKKYKAANEAEVGLDLLNLNNGY